MKALEKTRNKVLIAIVCILCFLICGKVWANIWGESSKLKLEVNKKETLLNNLSSIKSKSYELNNAIFDLNNETSQYWDIPNIDNFETETITLLEGAMKNKGIIRGIKFGDTEIYNNYSLITFVLSLESNYKKIEEVLEDIENGHIPLIIDKMTINKIEKNNNYDANNLGAEITIKGIAENTIIED